MKKALVILAIIAAVILAVMTFVPKCGFCGKPLLFGYKGRELGKPQCSECYKDSHHSYY